MNKKLLTPLFLLASFLVVGCSTNEIISRPKWIDDPIIVNPESGEKYKDNTLKDIYDAIKKLGDTNANVLNKVMYDIAQKQLGHFIDWEDKDGKHVGLKTVAKADATDEQINAFVAEYPAYKSEDKGYVKGADDLQDLTAEQKTAVSRKKIQDQYNRIVDNILEKLADEVKGGSYSSGLDKKLFQEQYFIDHLYEEMYWPDQSTGSPVTNRVILPKTTNQTWREYVNADDGGFLNVINNTTNEFYGFYFPHTEKEPDGGYIGRKILPDIYRTLLIENYVREQRSTNLGRSYARKVSLVTISADDNNKEKVLSMLTHFVKTYITGENEATPLKIEDDNYDFEHLTKAMVGFASTGTYTPESPDHTTEMGWTRELLEEGHFNPVEVTSPDGKKANLTWTMRTDEKGNQVDTGTDSLVYEGTKLGDLVKKYLLTQNVTWTAATPTKGTDFTFTTKDHLDSEAQSAMDDITNKNAYDINTGLMIKEREIRLTDMTNDGWFLKSGGLTDLDEDLRGKLFNIKTSNIMDKEENIKKTGCESDDTVRYFGELPATGSLANRKAFLRLASGEKAWEQIILHKGNNFHIVEVKEACSASKLSLTDVNGSYLRLRATDNPVDSCNVMNEITNEVTKQVASGDTYKKNAEQYYLMISNILFYDQSVYDYFKSQFPDLFK